MTRRDIIELCSVMAAVVVIVVCAMLLGGRMTVSSATVFGCNPAIMNSKPAAFRPTGFDPA